MVEWKKLGEVCSDIIVPMRDRPKVFDGNIPWCRIEDIEGMYFNKSMSGLMVSDKVIKAMNLKVFPTGTVICSCSATLGVCAINTQPLITNQTFIGLVCSECLNNHFLYYYMLTRKKELKSLSTTGTIPYVSREKFEKMVIPVPSITEQTRIVGILDTFTASIENLKQQIAQRRKQYNWIIDHFYYSDKYEMIKAANEGKVQVKTMDEIGTFIRGRRFVRTDIVQEGIPCIHYGDMYTYYRVWADKTPAFLTKEKASKLRFAKKGDVVIVAAGENDIDIGVGVAWLGENEVVVHDACFIFKHEMDPKYISYFLRSMNYHLQIRMGVVDGKICSISAKELGRTLVPVPSLPEQQRIVSILDTFEASIANLEQQLAQRERQYEYYRNKLLTFE